MTKKDKKAMLDWVKRWEKTGKILDKLRQKDILKSDTQTAIILLDDAFESAKQLNPLSSSSGLIEQQRFFSRSKL